MGRHADVLPRICTHAHWLNLIVNVYEMSDRGCMLGAQQRLAATSSAQLQPVDMTHQNSCAVPCTCHQRHPLCSHPPIRISSRYVIRSNVRSGGPDILNCRSVPLRRTLVAEMDHEDVASYAAGVWCKPVLACAPVLGQEPAASRSCSCCRRACLSLHVSAAHYRTIAIWVARQAPWQTAHQA